MKTVLVFGVFDFFHPGHRFFLNAARKLGDRLFVVVARDFTVEVEKKIRPHFSEKVREKEIEKTGIADRVFLGNRGDKFKIVREIAPEIVALGFDQKCDEQKLREILPAVEIHRIPPNHPEKFKSTIFRKKLKSERISKR